MAFPARLNILLAAVSILLAGANHACSLFEDDTPKDSDVRLADEVLLVEELEGFVSASAGDGTVTLTFSGQADPAWIDVGAILVGTNNGGFLRRVESITASGNDLVLDTSFASIADAVEEGEVELVIPTLLSSEEGDRSTRAPARVIIDELVLFDGQVGSVDAFATFRDGLVSFSPDIDVDATIGLFSFEYLAIAAKGELEIQGTLTASLDGRVAKNVEIEVASSSRPFVAAIGPLPVAGIATVRLVAVLDIRAWARTTLNVPFSLTASITAGGLWTGDGWDPLWSAESTGNGEPALLGVNGLAAIEIRLKPEVSLTLYGVAGPVIGIDPYLHWEGELNTGGNTDEVCWETWAGVEGHLGLDVAIFDDDLPALETSLIEWRTSLASECYDLPCVPDCGTDECGPDGCGGLCGICAAGEECILGSCILCVPACTNRECGPDTCGGSCGSCAPDESCAYGQCVGCTPDCIGRQCGSDGCGGSCGSCGPGESCAGGQCTCSPDCVGKECGPDGCGGLCGTCGQGFCNDGVCGSECTPECSGRACGPDGCGESCGDCGTGENCGPGGACVGACEACSAGTCPNYGFELGDWPYWNVEGDAVFASSLGATNAVEGSMMAIVSTGLLVQRRTVLDRNVCLPGSIREIRFAWKFYSEEFTEYCGSTYQDAFRVSLVTPDGESLIFERRIDDLCPQTDACLSCGNHYVGISPADVSFDEGDVYNTPWQLAVVDVSAQMAALPPDATVRLVLSVEDVGDSIYDTAVLVDDIELRE